MSKLAGKVEKLLELRSDRRIYPAVILRGFFGLGDQKSRIHHPVKVKAVKAVLISNQRKLLMRGGGWLIEEEAKITHYHDFEMDAEGSKCEKKLTRE